MALQAVGLKTHIWNNNLKSGALLASFPLLFLIMLWSFFLALPWASAQPGVVVTTEQALTSANQGLVTYGHWVMLGVALWFVFAWFFHQNLINRATGAVPVSRAEHPRVYNLLENLCISRGIPMPKVCVVESEALNAYASGINRKTYTVTLTTGLLNALDDKELETVLAHELSHILNKDVRLLIIAVIFVGILSFLAEGFFRALTHGRVRVSGRGGKRGGGAIVLVALVILLLGYLLAVLIRFALSRRREYLADAGAVELTKNPKGLIAALQKISGHAEMKEVPGEVRQMFIENPPAFAFMSSGFFSLFATHPPIRSRIAVLERML